jgi:uncharacterized Zn-finger protein
MSAHLKCEYCSIFQTTRGNLEKHQRTSKKCIDIQKSLGLQVEDPIVKCPYCNKDYNILGLKQHIDLCPVKKTQEQNIVNVYGNNATINIVAPNDEVKKEEKIDIEDHYIYCILEREFIKTKEKIYKVGKSTQVFKRIKQYPNDSKVILIAKVKDCHKAERELLSLLDTDPKVNRADKIGREYYECDIQDLTRLFYIVCLHNVSN